MLYLWVEMDRKATGILSMTEAFPLGGLDELDGDKGSLSRRRTDSETKNLDGQAFWLQVGAYSMGLQSCWAKLKPERAHEP